MFVYLYDLTIFMSGEIDGDTYSNILSETQLQNNKIVKILCYLEI